MQNTLSKKTNIDTILNNFSVWKLVMSFYLLLILSLGTSIYFIKNTADNINLEDSKHQFRAVYKLNLLNDIKKNLFAAEQALHALIYLTNKSDPNQEKIIVNTIKASPAKLKELTSAISSVQEQKLYEESLKNTVEIIKSSEEILLLNKKNRKTEAVVLFNKIHLKQYNQLTGNLSNLIDIQIKKSALQKNQVSEHLSKASQIIIFYYSVSIFIICIIGLLIYHNLKRMTKTYNSLKFQMKLSNSLIDSNPDAIVGINEKDEIVLFNKQAETIFEHTRNEVLYKKYNFLFVQNNDINFTKGINKNFKEFAIETNQSEILNNGKPLKLISIRDVSEKNRIAQIVKDNEKKFRAVFENSPNAIFLFNGLNYLDCNKRTLDMLGLENVGEFLKYQPIDFSPEFQPNGDRSEDLFKKFTKKTIKQKNLKFEWQLKRLNGELFYSEILLSYYYYHGKKVIQANVVDISDRIKTEDFISKINEAVSVKTGKHYFTELTTFLIEHLNVKYAFIGSYNKETDAMETISFRNKNSFLENFQFDLKNQLCHKTLESDAFCCYPSNVQFHFPKDPDLKRMNIESYLAVNLIYEGKTKGVIALMDDKPMEDFEVKKKLLFIIKTRAINELKQRNIFAKLKESQEFTKGILSSLSSQIAVINNNGQIIDVNKAWKEFGLQNGLSIQSSHFKKWNYIEVCEKAALDGDAFASQALIGLKKIINKELNFFSMEYLCNSDTEERWFEFRAMPFGRTANQIVTTHQDISQRKKLEQIQERQYLELKKTNSELDKFVYSISHDLRAPLTSMMGLIGLSYDCEITERGELLGMMKQSVLKLDTLITDILMYSRNKNIEPAKQEIDFKKLIETTRNNLQYLEGAKNIFQEINVQQNSTFISDQVRITYIINNLYSNAIKYADTTKNNSFIKIAVVCDDKNAVITFEDNGIGIAEKHFDKIFEMFYRSTNLSSGSGLGLYILKESIEKMNGKIALKSEENKGSIFTVSIPNLIS